MESVTGWISDFFGQAGTLVNTMIAFCLSALPSSPFTMLTKNSTVSIYLGYLNYFIPISFMLGVLQAWLVAVALYYIWQVLLRWVKAVE